MAEKLNKVDRKLGKHVLKTFYQTKHKMPSFTIPFIICPSLFVGRFGPQVTTKCSSSLFFPILKSVYPSCFEVCLTIAEIIFTQIKSFPKPTRCMNISSYISAINVKKKSIFNRLINYSYANKPFKLNGSQSFGNES